MTQQIPSDVPSPGWLAAGDEIIYRGEPVTILEIRSLATFGHAVVCLLLGADGHYGSALLGAIYGDLAGQATGGHASKKGAEAEVWPTPVDGPARAGYLGAPFDPDNPPPGARTISELTPRAHRSDDVDGTAKDPQDPVSRRVLDQFVDPLNNFGIRSLPEQVIIPSLIGKNEPHGSKTILRFLPLPDSSAWIAARSRRAFVGLRRRWAVSCNSS